MKVFTKMMCVMMVLLLSFTFVLGQSTNLEKIKANKSTTDLTVDTYDGVKPIANPNDAGSNVSFASSDPDKLVLFDNGPMITHPGGGFGGADASALQSVSGPALTTYGFGAQQTAGNSMADDFTVTGTWTLNTITFFSYQTGSTTTSTITGIYAQIWNGAPNAGGTVVWGNLTTNLLASTTWSSIYRSIETDLLASNRPIMAVVANVAGCVLSSGTYWVQYQFTGSLASGPWAPPISIWNQGETGNALQNTSTGWAAAVSGTTPYAQGVPFIIDGTTGGLPGNDLSVTSILAPSTGANLGSAEPVTIRIQNMGTNPQSNFPVFYTINGGAQVNGTVTATINSLATYDYTFATTANLSAYGVYNFHACVNLTGDENPANNCFDKVVENLMPSYCTASTTTEDEYIANVSCGTINNPSGWQGGVADYTAIFTTIDAGMSEDITVLNGPNIYASDQVTCWVDWNMDYTFGTGDEEFILTNVGGTGATFTGAITVPAGTPGGDYRMRVRMTYSLAPVPCGSASYGEIEDYTINVGGVINPNIVFEDNFDAYTAGGQVACQNPTGWTTWSNAPCGSEDAYVSNLYSYSSPNSAVIAQNNDLVKDFGDPYTSGKYSISFYAYIPATKTGYFNTLQKFTVAPQIWGLEVYFNAGGAGSINAGGTGTATFTWTPGTWFMVEHIIDMDNDMSEIWIGGIMIYSYQWSLGATGTGQNTLEANDYFGATANDQMYIDDYKLELIPPVTLNPPTNLTATVADDDVQLEWDAPTAEPLLGYNVYRDGTMIDYTTATSYDDMDLAEGTYGYYVTAVYDEGESVPSNTVSATISGGTSGVIFTYDFENYTSGGQVACQTPDEWTTWSNLPCDAVEDAYISSLYAHSGVNSAVVVQNNDLVKDFGEAYTTGKYKISFWVYIPTGKAGYFNTLASFAGTTSSWGLEVYFNLGGAGSINAGGTGASTFFWNENTWFYVENVVDLDMDWAEFWIDGNMLYEWQWTLGSNGVAIPNTLDANDFFGATANDQMFFDDYVLESFGALAGPTNLTLSLSGSNVVLDWDAPSGKSFSNNVPIQELPLTVTTELTNSVHNNLLNQYKQSGQEIKAEQLINNAKTPAGYQPFKLDIKGATAYAFVAYDPSSVNPIGPAYFDTDFPGTITSLGPNGAGDFIAGGSWAEGVWYGEEYGTGALYTIDPSSGAMSLVGYGSAAGGFNAIAYDVTTSTMFGCDYNGSSCGLYSIDLSSGANTYIGDVGLGALVIGLACDASGNLYAADLFTDVLISVDKATGAGTVIGPLGININYAQDLEYDNENDVLYLAGYTATGELYTVDPSTGDATFVGTFQGGAEICGLAFEYNAVQYTNDIGIQSILSPASGVNLGNEVVTVRIKNFGTAAQSNFNISYTLDGGTPVNATITNSIAGGATYDYTFTGTVNLSAYGTYEFVACTYLAGDENAVNDCKPKSVTNSEPSLCVPQYGTGCAFGDGFTDFVLAEIQNNGSGCADLNGIGWSQYFNLGPAMLSAGGTYDVIMTGGYDGTFASMWIDFNDDLVLSSDEEIFIGYELVTMGVPYTVSITIPANAPSGQHVMRARTNWLAPAPDPCALYTYGEAEDYIVQVGGGGTGLLGYNVYHSYQNGAFSVLDFVTPTNYTHFDPPYGLHKYYVTAVYDEGESGPTNTVQVTLTGVQETAVESTQIYPNPANSVVNIKSAFDITSVRVYNHAGQIIASELVNTKFYQFNTSQFTPGLYMFQIETNEGTITKRIIVE